MAKLTFVGGIHPYDGKDLSKDKPIQDVLPKGEMVYPLSQHIGAPAKPIVAKGDRVLAGQKIAESGGFVSAPIYASVSGTVKTIPTTALSTELTRVLCCFLLRFCIALSPFLIFSKLYTFMYVLSIQFGRLQAIYLCFFV